MTHLLRHGRAWMVALALFAGCAAVRAQAPRYVLDAEHLSIGFLVDHIGYAKVLGLFREARGSYRFDEATGTLSEVRIEVDTDSVFTNHRARDNHLRSAQFLNVKEYPRMVFTAEGAKRVGERLYEINGQLELLGQRQPLTLRATWNKSNVYEIPGQGRPYVMGVSARGSFKRSAFGMNYAVANGWVGDDVELIIEFEARRQ
ncbi:MULTISPECIES: YceI family protein [Caldimonas]|uniref:YceI family protein n=1 Tax=Caldimonas TaxID=196013 RepID=UPI000378345B|nr:YceI family protein [Caldimonas manganoxidans]GIX26009.1 MAG: protein YceI [Caldimonas sp.]